VSIGPVFILDTADFWIDYGQISEDRIENEVQRFDQAVADVAVDLKVIRDQVEEKLGRDHAQILDAHLLMAQDESLRGSTLGRIREYRYHAEYAYRVTVRDIARRFDAIQDPYFRSRKSDLHEVERRVMGKLCQREESFLDQLNYDAIVVAHDMQVADMVHMQSDHVLGIVSEVGGRTSHTAIMARGLEIPCVVGVRDVVDALQPGDMTVVDGTRGLVIINPDAETLERYEQEAGDRRVEREGLAELRDLPAQTEDGRRVQLMVNIELPIEAQSGLNNGAEGVGLFRTEYLFLATSSDPSESEQAEVYRGLAERMGSRPTIIRTLDLGGDKMPYLEPGEAEMNPFLGWRAIRVSLSRPKMFQGQLRAILRSSAFGDVQIMFPMIATVEELHEALAALEQAKTDLREEKVAFDESIQVGAMIEVPSAAILADEIARHVDFLSIGTNDLIQYTLAVDRGNDRVAYLFDPYYPSIVRLIKQVIDAGKARGVSVTVCGEMAGDPACAVLLLGMGVDGLSMSTPSLFDVKQAVRTVRFSDAEALAEDVMTLTTRAAIHDRVTRGTVEGTTALLN
jgi:phosphotransferase system enzyme I (PtsI)